MRYSTSQTKNSSKIGWSWHSPSSCYRSSSNFKLRIDSISFPSGFKTLFWPIWLKNKIRFCCFRKLYSSLPRLYSLLLSVTIIHSFSERSILVRFVSISKIFIFMICQRLLSCVKKEKCLIALVASLLHPNTTLRMDTVLRLMFGPVEWFFTLCLWENIRSICWATHLKTLNWNYKVKLWKGSNFQKVLKNMVKSFKIWGIIFIWMTFSANYFATIITKGSNYKEFAIIHSWKFTSVSP